MCSLLFVLDVVGAHRAVCTVNTDMRCHPARSVSACRPGYPCSGGAEVACITLTPLLFHQRPARWPKSDLFCQFRRFHARPRGALPAILNIANASIHLGHNRSLTLIVTPLQCRQYQSKRAVKFSGERTNSLSHQGNSAIPIRRCQHWNMGGLCAQGGSTPQGEATKELKPTISPSELEPKP